MTASDLDLILQTKFTLQSLGGLDDVFTHECEIRLNEGSPYKTALGENATWHGALAHAITITLREKHKEATIPNIWSLLNLNRIQSWATTADPTGEQPHSVKDADAFNEVLGQAQPKVNLPRYSIGCLVG
jgi:hypothetical protein